MRNVVETTDSATKGNMGSSRVMLRCSIERGESVIHTGGKKSDSGIKALGFQPTLVARLLWATATASRITITANKTVSLFRMSVLLRGWQVNALHSSCQFRSQENWRLYRIQCSSRIPTIVLRRPILDLARHKEFNFEAIILWFFAVV
jgi:hypothetical protein